MWLKIGTQRPGKEEKLSEIQPIIWEKLALNYMGLIFGPTGQARATKLSHKLVRHICIFNREFPPPSLSVIIMYISWLLKPILDDILKKKLIEGLSGV